MRPELTMSVLLSVGDALDVRRCYRLTDSAWFDLGDDRRISVRPDDACRFRVDLWHGGRLAGTVWATAGDWLRLAEMVTELAGEHALARNMG